MRKAIVILFGLGLAATIAGCCGGSSEPSSSPAPVVSPMTPATPATPNTAVTPVDTTKAMPMPTPTPAGGSNYGTVSLTTGFLPDPSVASGTAGGAVDASTINPSCRGWISSTPDHLFVANSAFNNLRIIARSDADTTLVVQGPDGAYRCNDDGDGLNPVVPGPFVPGTYRIWVGSYSQGVLAPYRIGFTELPSVTASQL
jgi:hypothetical protein